MCRKIHSTGNKYIKRVNPQLIQMLYQYILVIILIDRMSLYSNWSKNDIMATCTSKLL